MRSFSARAAGIAAAAATAVAALAPVPAAAGGDGVPPGQRGRVVSDRPLTGTAALPSASANRLVTYTSQGVGGRRITVSGTVSLPQGTPPHGGWPVISWAHGTTGTADVCAPSADTADGPVHDYVSVTAAYLDRWVARGYAVVQTDYEGLGTEGGHPYMNGDSAANTVVDIVHAARRLDRRIGRDWFAVGHSQGGQAALYTAAAEQRTGQLDLKGVVAAAPGGYDLHLTVDYIRQQLPGAQYALAFLPTLITGAEAADPSVVPEEMLTDEAAATLLKTGRTECTAKHREIALSFPLDKVFRPGADLAPLTAYLRSQDPVRLDLEVPTQVVQGTADVLVSKASTDLLVNALRGTGTVDYEVYQGADHRGVLNASFEDSLAFTEGLRDTR
ncbi:alpha/beta hydrolase family protein [Actinocorallia populi]|uniref:alpha/beta hydrolase family protein n=1 Tax=Actinocorallia populi TaxID=2079200 RepID=UPI000D096959|nr:alpha/beta hydrolase [Actinocorallia populi]